MMENKMESSIIGYMVVILVLAEDVRILKRHPPL